MNHLLFKTTADAQGVHIEILNTEDFGIWYQNQFAKPYKGVMKFNYDLSKLFMYPVGCTFISSNTVIPEFSFVNDNEMNIGSQKALFLNNDVYSNPTKPSDNPSVEELLYLFGVLLFSNPNRAESEEKIISLTQSYTAYGYAFDIDKILNPPPPSLESFNKSSLPIHDFITSKYPVPDKKKCGFAIDADVWFLAIRNAIRKENTLIVGPTGSGKTELMNHISSAMGFHLFIQDMGTIYDAQSALLGVHRLSKEGQSCFDYAPFAMNIQQEGIHLLDEINRAPIGSNNILFPCLDRRRYLPIDIADTSSDRHIQVHENSSFFATANLGAEYTGTHSLDRALLDRFMPIELDYPTESDEIEILILRTGCEKKKAAAIIKVCKEIRKQYKDQELSNSVSVRHSLLIASLVYDGFTPERALTSVIVPLFEDSVGASERNKVKSIIAAF